MENLKDDGGLAFPFVGSVEAHYGMTLRDYFAAKAMPYFFEDGMIHTLQQPEREKLMALACYRIADAMLKARKQNDL